MRDNLSAADRAKIAAAYHALSLVEDGMLVGLGTGSTAAWLVKLLGARRHLEGLEITAVSTSQETERLAQQMSINTTSLDDAGWLDLTIDGADEFDDDLTLIKGGGGALLREKIVAAASERMFIIADESKYVKQLGAFPLAVEVVRFAWSATAAAVAEALSDSDVAGNRIVPRHNGNDLFVTDEGHHILDLHLERIGTPDDLERDLLAVPGVVETGLFTEMADRIYVGLAGGAARVLNLDGEETAQRLDDPERLTRFLDYLD